MLDFPLFSSQQIPLNAIMLSFRVRKSIRTRQTLVLSITFFITTLFFLSFPHRFRAVPIHNTSCFTKITHTLQQLHKDTHSCFIQLADDSTLLAQALALDDSTEPLKFRCVTIAIKDNIQTKGFTTTAGSKAFGKLFHKEIQSAPVITALTNQGAIVIGKTNMDDFALSYHTFSTVVGQTRNCHDVLAYPGGSSGGCAVALSIGLVDLAIATDTGGSIRVPAAFAGIVGLRPTTQGLISTIGTVPLSTSRDTVGPMARDVDMVRNAFQVMAHTTCDENFDVTKMRIAILDEYFEEKSLAAAGDALRVLRDELNAVSTEEWPAQASRAAMMKRRKSASMYEFKAAIESYILEKTTKHVSLEDLMEKTQKNCESNVVVDGKPQCDLVVNSILAKVHSFGSIPSSIRLDWKTTEKKVNEFFISGDWDAVVYPTFTELPTLLSKKEVQDFCPNNRLAAITGYPAVTMFGGWFSKKRPMGIEFLAMPNQECKLFAIAKEFEKRFGKIGNCMGKGSRGGQSMGRV